MSPQPCLYWDCGYPKASGRVGTAARTGRRGQARQKAGGRHSRWCSSRRRPVDAAMCFWICCISKVRSCSLIEARPESQTPHRATVLGGSRWAAVGEQMETTRGWFLDLYWSLAGRCSGIHCGGGWVQGGLQGDLGVLQLRLDPPGPWRVQEVNLSTDSPPLNSAPALSEPILAPCPAVRNAEEYPKKLTRARIALAILGDTKERVTPKT
jgi:hypothetical protein